MKSLVIMLGGLAMIAALLIIFPADRQPRGCDEISANPTFNDVRNGVCR